MKQLLLPPIWIIVMISGLPQFSETVYSPSLPDIVEAMATSESMVEYTLTIYLFAFAFGIAFWGKLSDRLGRKICIISGFIIYLIGCAGCYFSPSIEYLLASRFVQAFGGSVGSVLGQSVVRDSFHGPKLGKVYSIAGSALAVFPAIGPVIGGLIAEHFYWSKIFLFLIGFGIFVIIVITLFLPETHHPEHRKNVSLKLVAGQMLADKKVLGFAFLVGACNGLSFSYYAEGSFYLIELLGLSPSKYGSSFLMIASASMLGGIISRKLHDHHSYNQILKYGIKTMLFGSSFFAVLTLVSYMLPISSIMQIIITISSMMAIMCGICMVTSNALAMALVDYKWCIGTASSLFGFSYYITTSLFSLGMGALHNGTLLPMPIYFLAITLLMLYVMKKLITSNH